MKCSNDISSKWNSPNLSHKSKVYFPDFLIGPDMFCALMSIKM